MTVRVVHISVLVTHERIAERPRIDTADDDPMTLAQDTGNTLDKGFAAAVIVDEDDPAESGSDISFADFLQQLGQGVVLDRDRPGKVAKDIGTSVVKSGRDERTGLLGYLVGDEVRDHIVG